MPGDPTLPGRLTISHGSDGGSSSRSLDGVTIGGKPRGRPHGSGVAMSSYASEQGGCSVLDEGKRFDVRATCVPTATRSVAGWATEQVDLGRTIIGRVHAGVKTQHTYMFGSSS